jgi:hypothetical protein
MSAAHPAVEALFAELDTMPEEESVKVRRWMFAWLMSLGTDRTVSDAALRALKADMAEIYEREQESAILAIGRGLGPAVVTDQYLDEKRCNTTTSYRVVALRSEPAIPWPMGGKDGRK